MTTRSAAKAMMAAAVCLAVPGFAQTQTGGGKTFPSAQAAAEDLIHAAQDNNSAALNALFGPQGQRVLTSGNPQLDSQERTQFAKLAIASHHLVPDPMNPNRMILDVGNQDWPFPVPLVRKNGGWSFDPIAGREEMQARRIGANELNTIEICSGYVDAQQQYAQADRDRDGMLEYAQHMMSAPGKQDGLYWQAANGSEALIPRRLAEATIDGANSAATAKPYHGYYFRILSAQGANAPEGARNYLVKNDMIGGFGLIAWPAEYSVTGIHTFVVSQDGEVYEKDFGHGTSSAVRTVSRFDPDRSWRLVD